MIRTFRHHCCGMLNNYVFISMHISSIIVEFRVCYAWYVSEALYVMCIAYWLFILHISYVALSTHSTPTITSSTTTLVKPTPQWPSRDHVMKEPGTAGDAADHPRSQPPPPSTVSQSPTSNRPSILRKRPADR